MKDKRIPKLLKIKSSLGPLENEVMQVVWRKDEVSVSDVTKIINNNRPVAYTTIMTVMDTLYKKSFLVRQKIGKAYQYQALAPKKIFLNNALFSVINDLAEDYGRTKVTFTALRLNALFVIQSNTQTMSLIKISQYKSPIGYGMAFTFLATILFYSVWELFQNFIFFGTSEYINLAFTEPALVFEHFNLIFLAIIESLPLINIVATTIFTILFIWAGKKLYKITNRNIVQLGGLA